MDPPSSPLERLAARLHRRTPLAERDVEALCALPFELRTVGASDFILRAGAPIDHCAILTSGFAFRSKVSLSGRRQIISIHLDSDFLDLPNLLLGKSDYDVQSAGLTELMFIPSHQLLALAFANPNIGRALWVDLSVDAAIVREWLLNIGRRDSLARTAHLICELGLRWEAAGLGSRDRFELPLNQEQLSDAMAMSVFHTNKTLKALQGEGLIHREIRSVKVRDWTKLTKLGEFDPAYLHLEGT